MTAADRAFIERSRYYLRTEYPAKLWQAVESLPTHGLWWRPNADSNSVGNLLMHLTGNVRQWIVGGVGQREVPRDRASEFAAVAGATAAELLAQLDEVLEEVDAVLARLEPADLSASRTIQGRETTVVAAIYHVVEHFAMHLGQIILVAKLLTPGAVRFYEDAGGLARPIWGDESEPPL